MGVALHMRLWVWLCMLICGCGFGCSAACIPTPADVDECADEGAGLGCPNGSHCLDTEGSYACLCQEGQRMDGGECKRESIAARVALWRVVA